MRAVWVNLAKKHSIPIRCVLFTASAKLCEHNDTVRALNLGPQVSSSTSPPASPGTGSTCLPDQATFARDRNLSGRQRCCGDWSRGFHHSLVNISKFTDCFQTNPENRTILPKLAFTSFASRYCPPKLEEGFKDITEVDFQVSVAQPQTKDTSRWYGI